MTSPAECSCDGPGLLALDQAVARAVALCRPVTDTDDAPLAAAAGRISAAPLVAPEPMPRFDHAAMDGYALRGEDLGGKDPGGSGPWQLPVAGLAAAGGAAPAVQRAPHALRILTGAPIPAGFDRVVMQEDCTAGGGMVTIRRDPGPGANIRRAGEDARAGQTLFPAGRRIDAVAVALAAIAGRPLLPVVRQIRVGVMTFGDELVAPGATPGPAAIHDSNRPMLLAALARPDIAAADLGALPDDQAAITTAIAAAAGRFDLIVSTGGASVGDRDHLKPAFLAAGGRIEGWRVAMKPGKPVMFGHIGDAVFLGLPGNPVAALLGLRLFGTAMIRRLQGRPAEPAPAMATAGFTHARRAGRREFLPARLTFGPPGTPPVVVTTGGSGAARLVPLATATGFAVIPAGHGAVGPGDAVGWLPFTETEISGDMS
ncbi:gephyrin-like molybdotransferase Glp [Tistrella mobilis]|uniref:molybdopterin molybdotransferase MoeA n=1 Tax=Tistrella mobilis TaxID=171437 RepID=UPI003556A0D8